jgi:aminoglycoside 2'-N-acetyltransferase I
MSLTILIRRTQQLNAATRVAIVELCTEAQQADFSRLFFCIPTGGLHFLAYRDDQIVSHAVVTTRWLQPAGSPLLHTAYVDAVATLPAYQGRGYGSAVMRALAANIIDYEIGGLQTDRGGFFTRLGWEDWRGPQASRSAGGLILTPVQKNVLILRLPRTPPLDLDQPLHIETQAEHTR